MRPSISSIAIGVTRNRHHLSRCCYMLLASNDAPIVSQVHSRTVSQLSCFRQCGIGPSKGDYGLKLSVVSARTESAHIWRLRSASFATCNLPQGHDSLRRRVSSLSNVWRTRQVRTCVLRVICTGSPNVQARLVTARLQPEHDLRRTLNGRAEIGSLRLSGESKRRLLLLPLAFCCDLTSRCCGRAEQQHLGRRPRHHHCHQSRCSDRRPCPPGLHILAAAW